MCQNPQPAETATDLRLKNAEHVIGSFLAACQTHPELLDVHESIRYVFTDACDWMSQK